MCEAVKQQDLSQPSVTGAPNDLQLENFHVRAAESFIVTGFAVTTHVQADKPSSDSVSRLFVNAVARPW